MPGWYSYIGGGVTNPANYLRSAMSPTCVTGETVCAIFLTDNTTVPTTPFSANRLQYIADGLLTLVAQPSTGSKFLYLKSGCC